MTSMRQQFLAISWAAALCGAAVATAGLLILESYGHRAACDLGGFGAREGLAVRAAPSALPASSKDVHPSV